MRFGKILLLTATLLFATFSHAEAHSTRQVLQKNGRTVVVEQVISQVTNLDQQDRQQLLCLAATIFYEGGSSTGLDQRAIGHVVMNRLARGTYGNTVCSVMWSGSFSFALEHKTTVLRGEPNWENAQRIAYEIVSGWSPDPTGGRDHYYNPALLRYQPSWARKGYDKIRIGAHIYMWVKG